MASVVGRGECVPYARYGETVAGVVAAIEAMRGAVAAGLDRQALQHAMPPGAARNALDCAFWDLESKRERKTGSRARRAGGAASAHHGLYDLARHARRDGGGGGECGRRESC